jgi:hypothetical protein
MALVVPVAAVGGREGGQDAHTPARSLTDAAGVLAASSGSTTGAVKRSQKGLVLVPRMFPASDSVSKNRL